MYKTIRRAGKYSLAIETFGKNRKSISPVYRSGIRIFETDHFKTYSIVIGTARIMLSIDKPNLTAAGIW